MRRRGRRVSCKKSGAVLASARRLVLTEGRDRRRVGDVYSDSGGDSQTGDKSDLRACDTQEKPYEPHIRSPKTTLGRDVGQNPTHGSGDSPSASFAKVCRDLFAYPKFAAPSGLIALLSSAPHEGRPAGFPSQGYTDMRLSRFFLPLLKETPSEAQIVSHRLMLRAGMIRQEAAGIYAWLPLGLRVVQKIERVVREEQNRSGAIELLMPTIQSADLWRESNRYDDYGKEMLRIKDRHDRDMLFGPTNEEMITEIFRASVRSYKDLPLNLYHIQWKFRDEVRPRFGVMRSREFLMKDAYSFDLDAAGARHSYNKMFTAYLRTFARLGLT